MSGPFVSEQAGVELIYEPKILLPVRDWMSAVVSIGEQEIMHRRSPGQQIVHVLDSEVRFFYEPWDEILWATATVSKVLCHPYLENWLSEPLRILLGRLIFPRLVARNFGDRKAAISLRMSPPRLGEAGLASLLGRDYLGHADEFWELYTRLLILIAESRGLDRMPNFESHPITRFYEEIILAEQGSRWVICLTLASAAEGLVKILRKGTNTDASGKTQGGVGKYLSRLVEQNVLEEASVAAWKYLRHSVMHGNLLTPWPTHKDNARMRALAELVHQLTRKLVCTSTIN